MSADALDGGRWSPRKFSGAAKRSATDGDDDVRSCKYPVGLSGRKILST